MCPDIIPAVVSTCCLTLSKMVTFWALSSLSLVALQPASAWVPLHHSRAAVRNLKQQPPSTSSTHLVLEASTSSGPEKDESAPVDEELRQAREKAASLVGQRVNVCWPTKDDAEYNGMVTSAREDGTVDLMYTMDNTYEQRVPLSRVELQGPQPLDESFIRPLPGEEGYDEALYSGGGGPNNTPRPKSSPEEDAATLEKYRAQLLRSNDNWQFSCLGDAHGTYDAGASAEEVARNTWLGLAQRWEARPTSMGEGEAGTFGYGRDLVEVLPPSAILADPANTPLGERKEWWGAARTALEVAGEGRDEATGQRCESVVGQERAFTLRRAKSNGAVTIADLGLSTDGSSSSESSGGGERASEALSKVAWSSAEARVLAPADLRGEAGTQACGCGHAFTKVPEEEKGGHGNGVIFEVCLRSAKGTRMRVELEYRQNPPLNGGETSENDANTSEAAMLEAPKWVLATATVLREALGRWPDPKTDDTLFGVADEAQGQEPFTTLYDSSAVPAGAASYAYRLLPLLEGRAVVCFPAVLEDGPASAGAVCLDWAPGPGRYQVDRKFEKGNFLEVASLELTELLADGASP